MNNGDIRVYSKVTGTFDYTTLIELVTTDTKLSLKMFEDDLSLDSFTGIRTNLEKIYFNDVVYITGYGYLHVEDMGDISLLLDCKMEGDVKYIAGNYHTLSEEDKEKYDV